MSDWPDGSAESPFIPASGCAKRVGSVYWPGTLRQEVNILIVTVSFHVKYENAVPPDADW